MSSYLRGKCEYLFSEQTLYFCDEVTGGDHAKLRTFCGVMDLPKPVCKSSFSIINSTIHKAACTVQRQSMKCAAKTEYSIAEDNGSELRDIDVSVDGTYMTRGHSSNVGVSTAVGLESGKVLDTGTKSKLCKSCEYWER